MVDCHWKRQWNDSWSPLRKPSKILAWWHIYWNFIWPMSVKAWDIPEIGLFFQPLRWFHSLMMQTIDYSTVWFVLTPVVKHKKSHCSIIQKNKKKTLGSSTIYIRTGGGLNLYKLSLVDELARRVSSYAQTTSFAVSVLTAFTGSIPFFQPCSLLIL